MASGRRIGSGLRGLRLDRSRPSLCFCSAPGIAKPQGQRAPKRQFASGRSSHRPGHRFWLWWGGTLGSWEPARAALGWSDDRFKSPLFPLRAAVAIEFSPHRSPHQPVETKTKGRNGATLSSKVLLSFCLPNFSLFNQVRGSPRGQAHRLERSRGELFF